MTDIPDISLSLEGTAKKKKSILKFYQHADTFEYKNNFK